MHKSILFIFIIILIPSLIFAQQVGKITSIQGKVDLLIDGKPPAVEAKINTPVSISDIIRTKTYSKAEITLNDGTVLKIAPRSRIDISEYISDEKTIKATIGLPRGKVGAFVAKETTNKIATDPKANKFEIKTPIAVAGVRGSKPIVTHRNNVTTVFVLEGKVYAYNLRFPENIVNLTGGQFTFIRENLPPVSPMSFTPADQDRELKEITIDRKKIVTDQEEVLFIDKTNIIKEFQEERIVKELDALTHIRTNQTFTFTPPITEMISIPTPPTPEPPTPPTPEPPTPPTPEPPTPPTPEPPTPPTPEPPTPPIPEPPIPPTPEPPTPPPQPPIILPPRPPIILPPPIPPGPETPIPE